MDLATLVGIVGAFAIVITAMLLGGSGGMFINVPSLLIVLVGTLFVVLMKFSRAPPGRRFARFRGSPG